MLFNKSNLRKRIFFTPRLLGSKKVGSGKRWNSNKYFLTTPIFYVNAEPHIGHLYTALIGDAAVRFQKLKNPDLVSNFMVGTDEHGQKVSQSAAKIQIDVKFFCDKVSSKYKDLFNLFNIEADDFVRTTEKRHLETAVAFWKQIYSKNAIYKDKYSGWYCVSDECFVSEAFLDSRVGKNGKRFTLEENKPVYFMEEVNYKFKLSSFQNDLLHWLKDENVVKPKIFFKELLYWVESGEVLKDVSVSRPIERVPWGIPVPDDPSQTIYVWLDALSSYLTASKYPNSGFNWPPNVQIIGKDILKFHGVFWPAFLMAADLDPPQCIFCHSHWIRDGEKMSKSKGNVIDPFHKSKKFTSDGFRYFLLREGVPQSNANFTDIKVTSILNSELADSLGNLLSRCTGVVNAEKIFPGFSEEDYTKHCKQEGESLLQAIKELPHVVETHFENFNFYKGIDAIIATLHLGIRFFQNSKPWELRKDPKKVGHLNAVLNLSMESLRTCGILLQPIIPNIACTLLDKLAVDKHKRSLKDARLHSWDLEEPTSSKLLSDKVTIFKRIKKGY